MHALTAMTRALREGEGMTGLVLCNGGVMSYQHAVVLSKHPGASGVYPLETSAQRGRELAVPEIEERPEGEATVEVSWLLEWNDCNWLTSADVHGRVQPRWHAA